MGEGREAKFSDGWVDWRQARLTSGQFCGCRTHLTPAHTDACITTRAIARSRNASTALTSRQRLWHHCIQTSSEWALGAIGAMLAPCLTFKAIDFSPPHPPHLPHTHSHRQTFQRPLRVHCRGHGSRSSPVKVVRSSIRHFKAALGARGRPACFRPPKTPNMPLSQPGTHAQPAHTTTGNTSKVCA